MTAVVFGRCSLLLRKQSKYHSGFNNVAGIFDPGLIQGNARRLCLLQFVHFVEQDRAGVDQVTYELSFSRGKAADGMVSKT
jgi:hypothetical protein